MHDYSKKPLSDNLAAASSLSHSKAGLNSRGPGNQALLTILGLNQRGGNANLVDIMEGRIQTVETVNRTGLPAKLKSDVETMSGLSLDAVRVQYNSDKPAQVGAAAYAQGTDIHVAPGQEKYLPHEAWHVVQQIQGRVRQTNRTYGKAINDDEALEKEAEQTINPPTIDNTGTIPSASNDPNIRNNNNMPLQRVVLSKVYPLVTGGVSKKYFSNLDSQKEFDKLEEALAYDGNLLKKSAGAAAAGPDLEQRYPTLKTYRVIAAPNILTNNQQGPHTLAHAYIAKRLQKSLENATPEKLEKLRKEQIPDLDTIKELRDKVWKKTDKEKKDRYDEDYTILGDQLVHEIGGFKEGQNTKNIYELFMRLMTMHPFAVYGSGTKTNSKRTIKGKGEAKSETFFENIDAHSRGILKSNLESFTEFLDMRFKLAAPGEEEAEWKKWLYPEADEESPGEKRTIEEVDTEELDPEPVEEPIIRKQKTF